MPTKKFVYVFVVLSFVINLISPTFSFAQEIDLKLPPPSKIKPISKVYAPAMIKAVTVNPKDPFLFDFIIDRGDSDLSDEAFEVETQKLVKYFLAALTIPESDLWVNLSPYEKDAMVPQVLGVTELGKDLLVEDYYLKQVTAAMTNPNTPTGKKFWSLAYAKAQELYGTKQVPINTFSKVWIVPDQATVLEKDGSAFIADSHLKVFLDQDYLAITKNLDNKEIGTDKLGTAKTQDINGFSSAIIRDVVLPEIEKEVNAGENFATVRQIYSSAILAAWYKKRLKESLLGKLYADQGKVAGVNAADMDSGDKIFEKYTAALKTGAYNIIKQDFDLSTQKILQRKYFSGGVKMAPTASTAIKQWTPQVVETLNPAAKLAVSSAVASIQRASSGAVGQAKVPSRFSVASVRVANASAAVTERVNARVQNNQSFRSTGAWDSAEIARTLLERLQEAPAQDSSVIEDLAIRAALTTTPANLSTALNLNSTLQGLPENTKNSMRDGLANVKPEMIGNPGLVNGTSPVRTLIEVAKRNPSDMLDSLGMGSAELAMYLVAKEGPQSDSQLEKIGFTPEQVSRIQGYVSRLEETAPAKWTELKTHVNNPGIFANEANNLLANAHQLDATGRTESFQQFKQQMPRAIADLSGTQAVSSSSALQERNDLQAVILINSVQQAGLANYYEQSSNPQIRDNASKISAAMVKVAENPNNFRNPSALVMALESTDRSLSPEVILAVSNAPAIAELANVQRTSFSNQQNALSALPFADEATISQALSAAGVANAPQVAKNFTTFRNENPTAARNTSTLASANQSEMAGAFEQAATTSGFQQAMTPYVATNSDPQWSVLAFAPENDVAEAIRVSAKKTMTEARAAAKQIADVRRKNPSALRNADTFRAAVEAPVAEDIGNLVAQNAFVGLVNRYSPPTAAINKANINVVAHQLYGAMSEKDRSDLRLTSVAQVGRLLASAQGSGALNDADKLASTRKLNTLLTLPSVQPVARNLLGEGPTTASSTINYIQNVLAPNVNDATLVKSINDSLPKKFTAPQKGLVAEGFSTIKQTAAENPALAARIAEVATVSQLMAVIESDASLSGKISGAQIAQMQRVEDRDIQKLGGIDLSAERMDLQINRDGNGVVLPISDQDLKDLKIDGLAPIILGVEPATPASVPFLMNLSGGTTGK
ncbi:MAG: hypothetical protein H6754_01630 [Candidatus Omnitrophica bacterium]|nr:hypothetical protein [Candidatus Omnitrophota bacterium]